VALLGWLLLSAGAVGVGCAALLLLPPELRAPPVQAAVLGALLLVLGHTALYPLAAWAVFTLEVYDDCVLVYALEGAQTRVVRYPLASTLVRLERQPWDHLLGTGTLVVIAAQKSDRYTLITPISWFDHLVQTRPVRLASRVARRRSG
jgi:hypothetical protein